MNTLVTLLLLFISSSWSFDLDSNKIIEISQPRIKIVSQSMLIEKFSEINRRKNPDYILDVEKFVADGNKLHALYDEGDNIVYLGNHLDLNNPHGKSFILHELVHFVQIKLEIKLPCIANYEKDAMEIQNTYLIEQNEPPFFSRKEIILGSACED